MRNVFGKIANGAVVLNVIGRIAFDCWREIPEHFAHVELDAFVIMPNHVHGILTISRSRADQSRGSIEDGHGCPVPLQRSLERFQRPTVGAIPTIVRSYKQTVTYLARHRLTKVISSHLAKQLLREGSPRRQGVRRSKPLHLRKSDQMASRNPPSVGARDTRARLSSSLVAARDTRARLFSSLCPPHDAPPPAISPKTSAAAAMVRSMSSVVWAAETKAASNWDGARKMLRSSISRKKRA